MPDRVVLAIGTKKGLFVAEAAKPRRRFSCAGPFGPGVAVYSALIDTRGKPRIYASSCNAFFGMKVLRSDRSRQEVQGDEVGARLSRRTTGARWPTSGRWSRATGKKELWCGVEPASLFRSGDGGDSWEMVQASATTSTPRKWQPGRRRALHAHDPPRRRPRAPRDLDRRPLPERGRRRDVRGLQPGRRRRLRARSVPRVRPVRAQDRAPQGRARPALHAEPRRLGEWDGPGGRRPDIGVLRSDDHGKPGARSPRGCRPTSAFPSSSTRTTPTRSTWCRWSR